MTGFVYFIVPEAVFLRRDPEHRVVKIGYTSHNPLRRMNDLAAGSPVALELAAYIEGGPALEKAFHQTFEPLRSHREWFYLQDKLADFVGYLYDPPAKTSPIDRHRVVAAVHDNIFATASSHPSIPDERYMASALPHHIAAFFPEVFA